MFIWSSQWKQHRHKFCLQSGDLVSGHQGVLLPLSSHLKLLVESSECCGCADDVPTLLLPDWDHKVIEAMVDLLYSGSATVTGDEREELLMLMQDLRFDISRDRLDVESGLQLPDDTVNHWNSDKSRIKKELGAEKQLSVHSSSTSEISSADKQEIGCLQKIRIKNVNTERKNKEQECVIKKLREALDFFESVQIMNEESFDVITLGVPPKWIRKPLDDLFSSLKNLPTESSIDILPTEIKSNILSYLCASGSLVAASVCLEWKEVLKKKLLMLGELKIGKHCSNAYSCEANECFMPEEMLKASVTVKLDVRLRICHPVKDIDAQVIAEGLANVSEFSITDQCDCGEYNGFTMLKLSQIEVLFETLERRNHPRQSVEIYGLNLFHLDQDKLINCLLGVKKLLLGHEVELNAKRLMHKIVQNTSTTKLSHLYLEDLQNLIFYQEEMDEDIREDIADALCQIETIYLGRRFQLEFVTIKRLLNNIIYICDIKIENLFIFCVGNWRNLIPPQDLKIVLAKLKRILFCGGFTLEQVEVARLIPGVIIVPYVDPVRLGDGNLWIIKKGFVIDQSVIRNFEFKLSEIFFNE